ncbi:hypothetical protein ACA910_008012 [Epithemia clementina (nom. ined.)]
MVDSMGGDNNNNNDLVYSFRQKTSVMRNWKPGSAPSNRDKLELYALHKQAASGDAPESLSTQSAAERAKYQAWQGKAGLSRSEAMRLYMQESDRQLRVYGTTATPTPLPPSQTPLNTPAGSSSLQNGTASEQQQHSQSPRSGQGQEQPPRGLAAIPLLCAAASESRQAYLRRLANTRVDQAWWARQEPLTATPGSLFALPEALLIGYATLVEHISITAEGFLPMIPVDVFRSFWWPTHNSLLTLWMAYILVATAWTAALELTQTIVWGSRRTGLALDVIWKEEVVWCAQSVGSLAEPHQPLTARFMGLCLWFYALLVSLASTPGSMVWKSVLYITFLCVFTWWYWLVVLPWLGLSLLGLSLLAGNCIAVIELAGV